MSKDAMYKRKSCFRISLQKENESCTVYSLMVYSVRIGTQKFARLYVEVPIGDKIGQNVGISLEIGLNLWTLHNPYMTPGLHGFKNLCSSCER